MSLHGNRKRAVMTINHTQFLQKLAETVDGQSEKLHSLQQAKSAVDRVVAEMSEEVAKGNKIICNLTDDLNSSRDKVKRKQAIILRQVMCH